ncbi:MAG: dolichyl-phosphate-mannose-mannosyltransferase family protein [Rhizorhabdus sp.]|nr:dolichyl-phosphate-mannose-mannosyltransferase family protein [Rhizorhabdus sp.]
MTMDGPDVATPIAAPLRSGRWWLPALIVTLIGLLYAVAAARGGAFYWSDGSRHAMDGAIIHDFVRAMPIHQPVDWLFAYYHQYPAIALGFYPPAHSFELAFIYAIFGVSQVSANILNGLHAAAMALAMFLLCRRTSNIAMSLAGTVLLMLTPELLFWGRQPMLELGMLTYMMWASLFALRYLDGSRTRDLAWAALLLVVAIYSKQTAIVFAPAFLIALFYRFGWRWIARPQIWITLAAVALLLIPLVILQLKFGDFNVKTVVHRDDIGIARDSLEYWTFYIGAAAEGLGWAVWALAAAAIAALCMPGNARNPASRFRNVDALLMSGWLLFGYILLCIISLKETRHEQLILPPLVYLAVRLADAGLRGKARYVVPIAASLLAICWLPFLPIPRATGLGEAADRAVALTPPHGRIAAYVYRDGNFIFGVRSRHEDKDITVLRIDKLLLDMTVMPGLGMSTRYDQASPDDIARLLIERGASVVVVQRDLWADRPSVQALYRAMRSKNFRYVSSVKLDTHEPDYHKIADIYQTVAPLPKTPLAPDAKPSMIGGT